MRNQCLEKQSLLQSLLAHGLIALCVILVMEGAAFNKIEVPIEITELIKAVNQASSKSIQSKQSQNISPKPIAQSRPQSDAKDQSTDDSSKWSNTLGAPNHETVAEEYEVSSLPQLLSEVRIAYPAEAKAKKITGAVVFLILVGSDGLVKTANVISSPAPILSDAAKKAILSFKFKPAILKEKPVAIQVQYTYRFLLE